jgi:hypothetical protein
MNKNFLIFGLLILVACSKPTNDLSYCVDLGTCKDCIGSVNTINGKTIFLDCFGRYGVQFVGDDNKNAWAIPYDWDKKYENESVDVKFCGHLFLNDVPILFPDPGFSPVYRIRLLDIESK